MTRRFLHNQKVVPISGSANVPKRCFVEDLDCPAVIQIE